MLKRDSGIVILNKQSKLEPLSIALIISLGIVILFWEVFFWGYVQVPGDIILFDPVMQEARPESGLDRPQNMLLSDHLNQFYVWHHLAAESMQNKGKIPLWNPYFLGGHPLLANAQPALFYPVNLLLFWFSPGVVSTIRAFFNIFIAGVFTYLFCRSLNISWAGSTLAAVAFAFSGVIMIGPGHAYINTIVWLPFVLWSGEKLLNGSHIYRWSLITGLGIGLSCLGGHPETLFHNAFIWGFYFFVKLIFNQYSVKKRGLIAAFTLAIGIGFLLGSVQLLPFVDFLSQGAIISRSRSDVVDSIYYSSEWLPNLSTLVTLLYPNFFGHPVENNYLWPFSNYQNFLEQSMYFGFIPVTLAFGAVFKRQKHTSLIIIAILAILTLVIAIRLPGFEAINYLPLFNKANNTRFKWTFTFLGTILAGFGFDAFEQYSLSNQTKNKPVFYAAVFIFILAFIILSLIILGKLLMTLFVEIPVSAFANHLLFSIFSLDQPKTLISIIVILVSFGIYWFFRHNTSLLPFFNVALIILTFLELIVMVRGYNTTMPDHMILPEVKLVHQLKNDPELFRIMSTDIFWPNYGAVYGLFHVGGYDLPGFKRYADIYLKQGGLGYQQKWSPYWPMVDWMNVKYIISQQELKLDKLALVLAEDNYKLYENKNVLPRAYMIYNIDVIKDEQIALAHLLSGTFDFRHQAILENALPVHQASRIQIPNAFDTFAGQNIDFVNYDNDTVTLTVFTKTPGLLVMSDLYAPGWHVQVDGQAATIYRANYAFRSVFIPAGEHTITFNYQPLTFQVGRILSASAIAMLIIGFLLSYRRHLA